MLITREVDYAIRILRKLQDGDQYTASEISNTEFVPKAFSYKILNKLSNAGIVTVHNGYTGGYKLSRDLNELSVFELLQALDSAVYLNDCLIPNHECAWKDENGLCIVHENLNILQNEVHDLFKTLTIQDLFKPQEKILGN